MDPRFREPVNIMGIKRQLKKVKTPGLSAIAFSACLNFLEPVLNRRTRAPLLNALFSQINTPQFCGRHFSAILLSALRPKRKENC